MGWAACAVASSAVTSYAIWMASPTMVCMLSTFAPILSNLFSNPIANRDCTSSKMSSLSPSAAAVLWAAMLYLSGASGWLLWAFNLRALCVALIFLILIEQLSHGSNVSTVLQKRK